MIERGKSDSSESEERVWEQGWKDHRRRQLERLARLPLADKLTWLEEAHRMVLHIKSGTERTISKE
jgi:hypothetical protein